MDRITLLLLPYAGGSAAAYQGWKARLPDWIDPVAVDLPGHGARHGQPVRRDWGPLIDGLAAELQPDLTRPFAIFGHSMGGLVGLELAHEIRARTGRTPVWFCASGCKAPTRRDWEPKWLDCPEEELVAELRRLGGTPPEVLASRELLDLILPVLRADFHLCGTYQPSRRAPLACPLLILGGSDDDASDPIENLSDWSAEFLSRHRLEMVEGGHFFIDSRRDQVVRLVEASLADTVGRWRAGPASGRLATSGASC